jgi:hypothetical protein
MWNQNQPTNKIQETANPHDEEKKCSGHTSLNTPYLILVSEAKKGQAWLVLRWETDLQRRLLRHKQLADKGGMPPKFQWSHSCQSSQKQPRPRGLRKWFLYTCGYFFFNFKVFISVLKTELLEVKQRKYTILKALLNHETKKNLS